MKGRLNNQGEKVAKQLFSVIQNDDTLALKHLFQKHAFQINQVLTFDLEEYSLNMSVLQFAVYQNKESIVKWSIEQGANLELTTDEGDTLLHLACFNNDEILFRKLLEYGANYNAINKRGDTVMHQLLNKRSSRYSAKVRLLMEKEDFNLNAINNSGQSIFILYLHSKFRGPLHGLTESIYSLIDRIDPCQEHLFPAFIEKVKKIMMETSPYIITIKTTPLKSEDFLQISIGCCLLITDLKKRAITNIPFGNY